ncbi:hypothetical protein PCANC_13618 [Puccinia coronata f. sp. avenae]|uniref:Uncharacterized protein n=1 Tax=Puccinia coronata f. sp. avenae TaxID=200324 RepID=A0A2N5UKN7_9BASI|nr:hypothetical protein PCANC_13618 [Puccinia coronata f. sp. avenae]
MCDLTASDTLRSVHRGASHSKSLANKNDFACKLAQRLTYVVMGSKLSLRQVPRSERPMAGGSPIAKPASASSLTKPLRGGAKRLRRRGLLVKSRS